MLSLSFENDNIQVGGFVGAGVFGESECNLSALDLAISISFSIIPMHLAKLSKLILSTSHTWSSKIYSTSACGRNKYSPHPKHNVRRLL